MCGCVCDNVSVHVGGCGYVCVNVCKCVYVDVLWVTVCVDD